MLLIDCTKLTPIFSNFDRKRLFSIIKSILSQIGYRKFQFWAKIFQIFSFFMSDGVMLKKNTTI